MVQEKNRGESHMKRTAVVISTVIVTACMAAPATASASEKKSEVTTIQYLTSLFSPAPKSQVVRPRKTKF
ncbi:MAG: hypothetical protein CL600_04165 [Alteromonas sp.]|nr:hypothetical protein [Alteromonas sp.]